MSSKITKSCLSVDEFGSSVNLLVRGDSRFKTPVGALSSIIIFIIFALFGFTKFLILYGRDDTKHTSLLEKNVIPVTEVFNMSTTNFNMAVRILPVDWSNSLEDYSRFL